MKLPLPRLRRIPDEVKKALDEHRRTMPRSPCVDQTEKDIETYYRIAPVGAPATVRNTQGGVLQYTLAVMGDRRPDIGRVYVQGTAYYMKHGKHCFHPKGQISLIVPTEEVVAWAFPITDWSLRMAPAIECLWLCTFFFRASRSR